MISLTAERWRRIETIFHAALQTSGSDRAEFLRASCDGDGALFAEMQNLLSACEDEARFEPPASAEPSKGRLGETVDGYELDGELGQGGMGTVYLAHRADGEFEQQVALKVVSSHRRTQFFTDRFRTERQILANLDHPNITRLLDGGVSRTGDPYLVMDYVDGEPLTRYCDRLFLAVPERIRLFLQACSAVEYAHSKLIVHRDLKPSNILVTKAGVAKLLDFGTAKLLLTTEAESTTTRFGAMTPRYASPEQLRGEPVSTSMDVYSLGVMLHELVTGAWPFGDPDSPIAWMERVVRDLEPAPARPFITEECARLRSTSRAKLARVLDGDLGNILLKTLQTDPHRRYSSVAQLSEDLNRYLTGEPVLARAGSVLYRAGKFVRRHAVPVSAAVLFTLLLTASAIYSFRQAVMARREAEKSVMVVQFLRDVLGSADPMEVGGKKDMTVLEALDRGRQRLNQLNAQPQVQEYLHYTLGIVFENLSDYGKAEEQLRSALAIGRKSGSDNDLAWAEAGLGGVLIRTGKHWDEAEDILRDAVARVRTMGRKADPSLVNSVFGQCAFLIWKRHGHTAEGEALGKEAVEIARTSPSVPRPWVVMGNYESAQYLMEENRDEEAARLLEEALSIERGFPHPTSMLGPLLSTFGTLRAKHGDFTAAEQYQRQYREETMRTFGPNHAGTLDARATWAVTRSRLGHTAEALAETKNALDIALKTLPPGSLFLWRPWMARAYVLNDAKQPKEAEACARASLECIRSTNADDPQHAASWAELGIALLGEQRMAEAIGALEKSERMYLKLAGFGPRHDSTMRAQRALVLARAGLAR